MSSSNKVTCYVCGIEYEMKNMFSQMDKFWCTSKKCIKKHKENRAIEVQAEVENEKQKKQFNNLSGGGGFVF
jgi:hypothetical protein